MPRSSAARASGCDIAAPPMSTFQRERSARSAPGALRSMCRMVGTQWEKVTRSRWMSARSVSGA